MAFDCLVDQMARLLGPPTVLCLNTLARCCRNRQVIHLFTITTIIYALFYDRLQHSYISHIYQHDKYGVVLTYTLLALYDLVDTLLIGHLAISQNDVSPSDFRRYNKTVNSGIELYAILTFAKVIVFNLIFKNNTSEDTTHRQIHRCCVTVLGVLALLSMTIRNKMQSRGYQASRATAVYALKFAAVAATFQSMGWYTDSINYSQWWANLTSTLLESYLIELTL